MSATSARTLSLVPHAAPGPVRAVAAEVDATPAGVLQFRFTLDADMTRVRVPERRASRRADELWRHTCFEAFVGTPDAVAYHELNFSPSTEWAIYSFARYREGMAPLGAAPPPQIEVQALGVTGLQLTARLARHVVDRIPAPAGSGAAPGARRADLAPAAMDGPRGSLVLALAAVIEDDRGRLSHWALRHRAGGPDFHHPDSFVLEL